MILVDYRAGSHELVEPLQQLGLPVRETTLKSADLKFAGRGEGGQSVRVGIEFKKLPELVGSLQTGRLQGDQLLKMRGALTGKRPAYDFAWLLIEGELHYDTRGRLQRRTGRREFRSMAGGMTVNELLKRVFVLHLCGGLNPLWSRNRQQTLKLIEVLYRVWTDQALDEHKSHLAIYQPPTLVPISQFRRTVSTLPGVGLRVSAAAEKRFKSIRQALTARSTDWAALETLDKQQHAKRLGTSVATRIEEALIHEY